MVYVELLVDVAEGGRDLAKAIEAADAFGLSKGSVHYPRLKVVKSRGETVPYKAGATVTMHEASAEKWVKRGLCKVVEGTR
jgi:hypothetical protein